MNKIIAVDFDGVIHKYSKKWHDGSIYDVPIDGCKDALQKLKDDGCYILIYTTRAYDKFIGGKFQKNQVEEIKNYLVKHNIPFDKIYTGKGKPLCKLFIDDNAIRFDGDWNKTVSEVKGLIK